MRRIWTWVKRLVYIWKSILFQWRWWWRCPTALWWVFFSFLNQLGQSLSTACFNEYHSNFSRSITSMLIISWTRHPWNQKRKRGLLSVSQQVLRILQLPHTFASYRKDSKRPDLTWNHKTVSLQKHWCTLEINEGSIWGRKKGSTDISSAPPCILGRECGGADTISSFRRQLVTTS